MQFKCRYSLIVQNISTSIYSVYQTVLFQTVQFSISMQLVLSGATIPARVDLGAMAIKGYSAFPKVPALLEPHHQIV